MPDFFVAPCERTDCVHGDAHVVCRSITTNDKFGLNDDPPPAHFPAYIMHYNEDEWIAEVHNSNQKQITFKAIDNCVPVLRPDGNLESRCDGMLIREKNLVFVELKNRASSGWLSDGRQQLTITILNFRGTPDANKYNIIEAYVANKQKPLAITGNNTEVEKFKDATGLLLKADRIIVI